MQNTTENKTLTINTHDLIQQAIKEFNGDSLAELLEHCSDEPRLHGQIDADPRPDARTTFGVVRALSNALDEDYEFCEHASYCDVGCAYANGLILGNYLVRNEVR